MARGRHCPHRARLLVARCAFAIACAPSLLLQIVQHLRLNAAPVITKIVFPVVIANRDRRRPLQGMGAVALVETINLVSMMRSAVNVRVPMQNADRCIAVGALQQPQ